MKKTEGRETTTTVKLLRTIYKAHGLVVERGCLSWSSRVQSKLTGTFARFLTLDLAEALQT